MRLSFLSFLKKNKKTLKTPKSIILKELKSTAEKNNLLFFENITVYHYGKKTLVPLIILDPKRGIYIFESKEYLYEELNSSEINSTIEYGLATNNSYELVEQKLSEMLEGNSIPLYCFYLMEHLNSYDYEHLNPSIKDLLPYESIMFNDFLQKDILNRLHSIETIGEETLDAPYILSNLLVQYLILDSSENIHLATQEQMKFIDSDFRSLEYLCGESKTGRTDATLQKVILQKLKNPDLKITIIKPTTLSCDLIKRKLLNLSERAIIDADIASIEVITPLDLLQKHLEKLKKRALGNEAHLSGMLMNKEFNAADVIVCDDSDTMTKEFIKYLRHIQKNSNLLIISSNNLFHQDYIFTKVFKPEKREVVFEKTNPHAKVFHIVASLLKNNDAKDILIVASQVTKENLTHDLGFYIDKKVEMIDSSKKLLFKNNNSVMISTYSETNSLEAKFVILLDICFADEKELEYAYNLAYDTAYILYRGKSDNLSKLRNNFEDNKK